MYKTGEFAKLAGTTEKTIRYYDRIGILKPSNHSDKGYRLYTDADLLKLQKILFLKKLGFELSEIVGLVEGEEDFSHTLAEQKKLISQKISSLKIVEDSITQLMKRGEGYGWADIAELIRLMNESSQVADNYRDSRDLNVRIRLHNLYSTNPIEWFDWVSSQIQFTGQNRILEVGCGNGLLWSSINKSAYRNREVFLTDKSTGMVEEVRKRFGKDVNCLQADCESIPFKDSYFDLVIANHVLFYLKDISRGLAEIVRVLRPNGQLICTSYSENHMQEISDLCREFNPMIYLSSDRLQERFGYENGKEILERYFDVINCNLYRDQLKIDRPEPLLSYILSCHGNQTEILTPQLEQFKNFLSKKIKANGAIFVTKEACVFDCKHPKALLSLLSQRK